MVHTGLSEPSSSERLYLDVAITAQQRTFLNPTQKQVLRGFILYDAKGKGASQRLAKRRLDFVSGNVSSYSRLLNGDKRMQELKEVSELTRIVATISEGKAAEAAEKKAAAAKEKEEKAEKKRKEAAEKEEERQRLLPAAITLVKEFLEGDRCMVELESLSINQLKLICKTYYCATGFKDYKKKDWVKRANELLVSGRVAQLEKEKEPEEDFD